MNMIYIWKLASICWAVAIVFRLFDFFINFYYPLNLSVEEYYRKSANLTSALERYSLFLCSEDIEDMRNDYKNVLISDFEDLNNLIVLGLNNYRIYVAVLTPNTPTYQNLKNKYPSVAHIQYNSAHQNLLHNIIKNLSALPSAVIDFETILPPTWSRESKFVFNFVVAADFPDEEAFQRSANEIRQIFLVFAKLLKRFEGDIECDLNFIVKSRIGISEYLQTVFVQDVGNIQYLTTRNAVKYAQSSSSSPFYYSNVDICVGCTAYTIILYWTSPLVQVIDTSITDYSSRRSFSEGLQYLPLPDLDGSMVFIDSTSPLHKRALFNEVVSRFREFMDIPRSNSPDSRTVASESDKVCRDSNFEDMFITANEAQHYQLRRLQMLHWKSVAMLGEISRSSGVQGGNPLLLWWLLRADYTELLRHILRSLREIDQLLQQEKMRCNDLQANPVHNHILTPRVSKILGNLSAEILCRLHDPVRVVDRLKATVPAVYESVKRLYMDSEGPASRVEFPVQEIFALFGPFWIPLTIPAYRMFKFYQGRR